MNKPELPSMVSTQAEIEAVSGDASKSRAELLALAEKCGAILTGKPDGTEAITVVFSIDAWRKFDASQASLAKRGTEPSDEELRQRWRDAGGRFYGPNVETGAMPESLLLPFLRDLAESAPSEKLSGAEADPLQGAADWFKKAIVDCDVADIQSRLLIGYNRAKRLFGEQK